MMNAETTVELQKIHPLSVAALGSRKLGGGKSAEFASGVFLFLCGRFQDAEIRFASVRKAFPSSGWYLDRMEVAVARAMKTKATADLEKISELARKKRWPELRKAVESFRSKYGAYPFIEGFEGDLRRLEGISSPVIVRSMSIFRGKCSREESGGIRLAYGFSKADEHDDWVWGPLFDAYSMGTVERRKEGLALDGASLRHLGRFSGASFTAEFRGSLSGAHASWGAKILGIFVKLTEKDKTTIQLCRTEFKNKPFFTSVLSKGKSGTAALGVAFTNSDLVIRVRGEVVYRGKVEAEARTGGFALYAARGTEFLLTGVEMTGMPTVRNLDKIEAARQAKKKAERLFRSAPVTILVTPGKVSNWDPEALVNWAHGKGELSVEAVDKEIDMESTLAFEDAMLEAVLRASGKGEASIDLHDNSGEEREIIAPTGAPGQWFKLEFALYGGHGWGSINGIPAMVDPRYASILPGLIELDVEPGSGLHIRSLKVRSLKRRKARPQGWVRMFNGADLTGWVFDGPRKGWQVREGAICATRPKPGLTRLRSLDYWVDFEFKAAVKVEEASNGRIFFRWDRSAIVVSTVPPDGRWHQVFVSVRDGKVRATLDGTPTKIGNTGRNGFMHELGNFGLAAKEGTVWFKDLMVKALR
jgi:hypothetical protein